MDKPQRVGFWRSTTEPDLPMPVAQDTPEEGQGPFLASLRRVEVNLERLNKAERYRGISRCRICGQGNGCAEFTHRGFVWPSGFSHYVAVHNVKVPVDFRDMGWPPLSTILRIEETFRTVNAVFSHAILYEWPQLRSATSGLAVNDGEPTSHCAFVWRPIGVI